MYSTVIIIFCICKVGKDNPHLKRVLKGLNKMKFRKCWAHCEYCRGSNLVILSRVCIGPARSPLLVHLGTILCSHISEIILQPSR